MDTVGAAKALGEMPWTNELGLLLIHPGAYLKLSLKQKQCPLYYNII